MNCLYKQNKYLFCPHYTNRLLLTCFVILLSLSATKKSYSSNTHNDLHYSSAGFFDIHVCNWPGRPLFFMGVFSTYSFNDISAMQLFSPKNKLIGEFNLKKYRLVIDKKKKEKRVFIKQFEIPKNATDGWYYTKVTLKNGETVIPKDYVIIDKLEIAKISTPDINKELKSIPKSFVWKKTSGAKFYLAFIRDNWDSKLIYKSKLLTKPEIHIPNNLLKNGGLYSIQIHARDTNEHKLLGDFNHGSLTKKHEFSIVE